MPRLTTSQHMAPDDVVGIGTWFELGLDCSTTSFEAYRIRIGQTYLYVRVYPSQTEVYRAEVSADGEGLTITTWPKGLEALNGPRRPSKVAKKKRRR